MLRETMLAAALVLACVALSWREKVEMGADGCHCVMRGPSLFKDWRGVLGGVVVDER